MIWIQVVVVGRESMDMAEYVVRRLRKEVIDEGLVYSLFLFLSVPT